MVKIKKSFKKNFFLFIIYFLFGTYLIIRSLEIIIIPESLANIDKWIIFIAGILVIIGGINHMRVRRRKGQTSLG